MHFGKSFLMRGIAAFFLWTALINSQASADSDDSIPWAKVGGWRIAFDPSVSGCFMYGSWEGGDVVRMGIDRNQKTGYLFVGNSDWRSLEVGKEYGLTFQFDGETPWRGMFAGKKMGKATVLVIHVDAKFMYDFAAKQALIISYDDRIVTRLKLTGSSAAMQSVVQCQDKVDSVVAGRTDPFARQTDPFAKHGAEQPPLNRKPDDPFSGRSSKVQAETF